MSPSQNSPARALLISSLCLHIGFVGASASAVGLLGLFDGETTWALALVMAFSGGVAAATGWRLGRKVLEHRTLMPHMDADAPSVLIAHPFQADSEM